ncbi:MULTISPECIES: 6-phospho-3-hexuloisomerase [Bacillaceae]|uniref:6-phospho-3-hexuloisomerase n=1 Tax=Bacillaceae TaxID=186817 RepID=UPI001187AA25|nr:6-phospho-3-hexuloisomerase [Bacillus sp. S3]QCJ44497.1 6-phospho-3-hexuloisomerase [Bacillus sp. S3]
MFQSNLKAITVELSEVFDKLDEEKATEVVELIQNAPRIFAAGAGRSGLVMKAFSMRLMHMGFEVHVIGDVTTPNARSGDLFILGTGSGETGSLITYANKAKKLGLNIITLTSFVDSTLGNLADITLQIPAPTPKSDKTSDITSIQPMGALFEQSLLICLDGLIMELMAVKTKDAHQMFQNHANLE